LRAVKGWLLLENGPGKCQFVCLWN